MANLNNLRPTDYSGVDSSFNNLAKMFAPPAAQDVLAAAQFRKMQADQQRQQEGLAALAAGGRQDLVDALKAGLSPDAVKAAGMMRLQDLAQKGGVTREQQDNLGVASGLYNPSNSYGMEADREATKLNQTKMQQDGETERALLTPVAAGSVRFNTPGAQQKFSVPAEQRGAQTEDSVKAGLINQIMQGGGFPAGGSGGSGSFGLGGPVGNVPAGGSGRAILPSSTLMRIVFPGSVPPPTKAEQDQSYLDQTTQQFGADSPQAKAAQRQLLSDTTPSGVDPNKPQSEAASLAATEAVKRAQAIQQAAMNAGPNLRRLQAMIDLNSRGELPQGPFAEMSTDLQNLLNSAGYPVDQGKLADAQTYQNLVMQNILDMAQSLKPVSNLDLAGLEKKGPTLVSSQQGRAQVLGYLKQELDRVKAQGDFTNKYLSDRQGVADASYPIALSGFVEGLGAPAVSPFGSTAAAQAPTKTATGRDGKKIGLINGQWVPLDGQ